MNKHALWLPEEQPDILGKQDSFGNIEWTYPEIIDHLYEKLRTDHPDHITRHCIGKDSSGKYDIYAYKFGSDRAQKTIYLQSGVHCIETEGYFGLARVMQLVYSSKADERLKAMRENTRFIVVPAVSVYGISVKGSLENVMGAARYQIPHNIHKINPNRDFYTLQAEETRAVRNFIASRAAEIDFAFDLHTTTMPEWNAYLFVWPDGVDRAITEEHMALNEALYTKNKPSFPPAYMGPESSYPAGAIQGSFTDGLFNEFHIPALTVEHSDYVFDKTLGTSRAITRAVELYMNHILMEAER